MEQTYISESSGNVPILRIMSTYIRTAHKCVSLSSSRAERETVVIWWPHLSNGWTVMLTGWLDSNKPAKKLQVQIAFTERDSTGQQIVCSRWTNTHTLGVR